MDSNNNNLEENGNYSQLQEINGLFKDKLNLIFERIFCEIKDQNIEELFQYLRGVYDYNVLNGKQLRGMFVVNTFEMISAKLSKEITEEEREDSCILGWVIEILQSFALIMDDIMDGSVARRGQLCWYKKVGMSAINDAILLEQHCYQILRIFFSKKSYYIRIVDAFHKMTLLTSYGQLMDLKCGSNNGDNGFKNFTESCLESIYKHKTSYYSFVFPVKLGMIISSCDSEEELETSERILLKIGHLFQIQDDFLDCFGDSKITGKIGTDIEEGKCCWPIVKALKHCDERQLSILRHNYGIKSKLNVKSVKEVYEELNLRQLYETESNNIRNNILSDIKDSKTIYPEIYEYILSKIVNRNK